MVIKVRIDRLSYYYRKSTREWVVFCSINTDSTSLGVVFSNKRLNKAKKNCVKWMQEGILGEEMGYRLRNHEIHFMEG